MARIYKRKIAEWVKAGKLAPLKDAYLHEWIAPSFPWIDEAKELDAQGRKIELSIATHGEICKALQHDRDQVVDTREVEIRDAITRAKNIKEQTGVDVPYQLFCGLPIQNAAVVSSTGKQSDTTDTDKDTEDTNATENK